MNLISKSIRNIFIIYSEFYGYIARKLFKIYSLMPSKVTFKITNICNVDCHFCYNVGKNTQAERKKEISVDKWMKIVDSIPFTSVISFTGGEAFLYPKIFELIQYIGKKRRKASVVTNATTLTEEEINILVDSNLYYLMISIHGDEKMHNEILKGSSNHYQKIIKNIKTLNEIKKKKNSKFPILGIKVVITNENYTKIPEILKLAENDLGASHVYFNLLSDEQFETFDKVEESFTRKAEIFSYDRREVEKIKKMIDFIFEYKTKSKLDIGFTNFFKNKEDIKRYIEKPKEYATTPCNKPWHEIYIQPNGDVSLCLKYIITNIENINYDLRNLIHLPNYRAILSRFLSKNRKVDYCRNCLEAKFEHVVNDG